ncbi:hypothetical protein [Vibrio tarriae]|uniref:hypothetical protein n=1 Tax=Vibrio tarriae TaxID=2014742 RepID=UPI000DE32D85|nr:hypothetical protein [Vibrio tarriae]EGR0442568.1 hypothetical protein [Vibrio cholerae]EGR0451258.1 hypothetical protein [Vibrio cholerae]EJL6706106.1 hypothetical protein [Vibrio cholerae]MVB23157.1 hypothetical protein [Vibrio cholerae]MVB51075.1 hypothetical protein [Vibrio cholerae]
MNYESLTNVFCKRGISWKKLDENTYTIRLSDALGITYYVDRNKATADGICVELSANKEDSTIEEKLKTILSQSADVYLEISNALRPEKS